MAKTFSKLTTTTIIANTTIHVINKAKNFSKLIKTTITANTTIRVINKAKNFSKLIKTTIIITIVQRTFLSEFCTTLSLHVFVIPSRCSHFHLI